MTCQPLRTIIVVIVCLCAFGSCQAPCHVSNISVGFYVSTCRFFFDGVLGGVGAWQWFDSNCPSGVNSAARGTLRLPVNVTLQQCAEACGAQSSLMGVPAKSVLYWLDDPAASPANGGCQCYPWSMDNAQMSNTIPMANLTMGNIICADTPAPTLTPTPVVATEVIQNAFYDAACSQPSRAHVVQLQTCNHVWPELADYTVFSSCSSTSGITANVYFNNDPTCNGTSIKLTLPVGQCYEDSGSGLYLVNSCATRPSL